MFGILWVQWIPDEHTSYYTRESCEGPCVKIKNMRTNSGDFKNVVEPFLGRPLSYILVFNHFVDGRTLIRFPAANKSYI